MIKKTNVIFFCYNRYEKINRTFEKIIAYNPEKIYIYLDGLNNNENKVNQERLEIIEKFQSYKNVDLKIREKNFGSKENIYLGVFEVLKIEDQVIIIEDDCLVTNSTFDFINEMLNYYKDNKKIISVSGYNPIMYKSNEVLFSYHFMCWGWGAWSKKLLPINDNPENLNLKCIKNLYINNNKNLTKTIYWLIYLYLIDINSWDSKIVKKILASEMSYLVCYPAYNTVKNIGFDEMATRTFYGKSNDVSEIKNTNTFKKPLLNYEFQNSIDKNHFKISTLKIFALIFYGISPRLYLITKKYLIRKSII